MNFNIGYNEKYTCGQMLDMLTEDSSLSFICDKQIYFMRNGKLYRSAYLEVVSSCDTKEAEEIVITSEMFKKTFYLTDLFISNIIFETKIENVADYLLEGYMVMLTVNARTWVINIEDNEVSLDYSDIDYIDESNFESYFARDIVAGILEGQWFVIDGEAPE